MEPTFENLVTLLENHKAVFEGLLYLGREKQRELINGAVEAIDAVTRKEEQLIYQAGRLEEERFQCTKELFTLYDLDDSAALSDIIRFAPPEAGEKLKKLQTDMVRLLGDLERINQENLSLIRQSLMIIDQTLSAISEDDEDTYTSESAVKKKAVSKLLDKRV